MTSHQLGTSNVLPSCNCHRAFPALVDLHPFADRPTNQDLSKPAGGPKIDFTLPIDAHFLSWLQSCLQCNSPGRDTQNPDMHISSAHERVCGRLEMKSEPCVTSVETGDLVFIRKGWDQVAEQRYKSRKIPISYFVSERCDLIFVRWERWFAVNKKEVENAKSTLMNAEMFWV